jgi:hypothetical protein
MIVSFRKDRINVSTVKQPLGFGSINFGCAAHLKRAGIHPLARTGNLRTTALKLSIPKNIPKKSLPFCPFRPMLKRGV